jgi:hypothetical protein
MTNASNIAQLSRTPLEISPIQWSRLKDIDEVEPINDHDTACLAAVREVLKNHGKLERFGVALLHSHFSLAPDEIMLETSDEKSRTLTLQPVKESEVGGNNVGTIWMLRDGDNVAMTWCRRYCRRMILGHNNAHDDAK